MLIFTDNFLNEYERETDFNFGISDIHLQHLSIVNRLIKHSSNENMKSPKQMKNLVFAAPAEEEEARSR